MGDVNSAGDPASASPGRSVGFLISQLGFAVSRSFHAALAPIGVDPKQFLLMRLVSENEGKSQHALGEALSIPASRMVALIDDLEEQGLLERRPNPEDRRARALHLTGEGRRVLADATSLAIDQERRMCEPLTVEERRQLMGLLRRLAEHQRLLSCVHPGLHRDEEHC